MAAAPAARAHPTPDTTGVVLYVVAAAQVLPGLVAAIAPAVFYDAVASYPPENHHVLRDVGSWQIALGVLAFAAARRPGLRAPVLLALAIQYGVHAISHLIDVDASDPAWQGPAALVLQLIGAVVLTALAVKEHRTT